MANEITYFNTPYTFIDPVRYFKANDPYYYEVDNIPIKQLEESSKFLKDQVDGLLNFKDNLNIEIDRKGFSELKPYATGNDRKVRVKPGKYTARVNNAYDITPLQTVEQIAGFSVTGTPGEILNGQYKVWESETINGDVVKASLDEFQQGLLGAAFMMNGLYERAFVYPIGDLNGIDNPANPFKFLNVSTPGYGDYGRGLPFTNNFQFAPYPNYQGSQPGFNIDNSSEESKNAIRYSAAKNQGRMESTFIKRWRGAIRTSVVDIPEELEITIPDYDSNDFFYFDSNGVRQPLDSNQRIDLLFIYTKAIDESSTTINKFDSNGNPTQLTRAELGIVKGAGVGLSRELASNNEEFKDLVDIQSLDGTPLMVAHPGDENGSDVGFSTSAGFIKGSFPSPDDLMNLAPVLSENLETNALPLIGQSILPIAYIRVQTAAGPIADLITEEDIIDIRPFFRTTELAYNERAGIAAATPQVSIVNPVVTETYLDQVRSELYTSLNNKIEGIQSSSPSPTTQSVGEGSRIIATGQLTGGHFGPEGALMRHASLNVGGGIEPLEFNVFADIIEDEFSYTPGSIGHLPQWDKADWYTEGGFTGQSINDYINVGLGWCSEPDGAEGRAALLPPARGGFAGRSINEIRGNYPEGIANFRWAAGQRVAYEQSFGNSTREVRGATPVGLNNGNSRRLNEGHMAQIFFVKKRINLNFDNTPWVSDYQVNVDLLNCIPLSTGAAGSNRNAQSSNVWVNKYKDYFVINVAWIGNSWGDIDSGIKNKPWANRNDVEAFTGFTLPEIPLIGNSPFKRTPPRSIKTYMVDGGSDTQSGYRDSVFFNDVVNAGIASNHEGYASVDWLTAMHPLLYPSVTFQVVGLTLDSVNKGKGTTGTLRNSGPTINCI